MYHNINVFPCWLPSLGVTARVSQHETPNHKSPLNNTDGRRVTVERASRSEPSGIDAWQAEQLDQGPAGQVECGAAFSDGKGGTRSARLRRANQLWFSVGVGCQSLRLPENNHTTSSRLRLEHLIHIICVWRCKHISSGINMHFLRPLGHI